MKTIKIILLAIIGIVLLIALAGHYKFNILQDDIYVEREDGSIVKYNDLTDEEKTAMGSSDLDTTEPANAVSTELAPLLANGWYWKETRYNNDTTISPAAPANFLLTFMEDGRVSATTDCNNGSGSYQIEGNMVTFGPMATTIMACPGKTQETEYLSMLGEIQSYFIDKDSNLILEIKYDSGVMIFMPAR